MTNASCRCCVTLETGNQLSLILSEDAKISKYPQLQRQGSAKVHDIDSMYYASYVCNELFLACSYCLKDTSGSILTLSYLDKAKQCAHIPHKSLWHSDKRTYSWWWHCTWKTRQARHCSRGGIKNWKKTEMTTRVQKTNHTTQEIKILRLFCWLNRRPKQHNMNSSWYGSSKNWNRPTCDPSLSYDKHKMLCFRPRNNKQNNGEKKPNNIHVMLNGAKEETRHFSQMNDILLYLDWICYLQDEFRATNMALSNKCRHTKEV